MRKTVVVSILFYSFSALVFFGCAGRADLPFAWAYFLLNAIIGLGTVAIAESKNPGFAQERLRPAPGEQDRLFKPVGTISSTALLILAALDVGRFHWRPVIGFKLQLAAFLLDMLGLLLVCWSMLVNSFFSSAVRLQPDRGQVVVSSGPYRVVRHPGYTGGILYLAMNGLALGSWWAGLAAVPMLILTIRRTVMEDAMLQSGLAGYSDYAHRVPYRLVPGIW
jgi:protein-S-isoprenylcysteine O-methyltransferase Ste14